jgi:hypothetical protein
MSNESDYDERPLYTLFQEHEAARKKLDAWKPVVPKELEALADRRHDQLFGKYMSEPLMPPKKPHDVVEARAAAMRVMSGLGNEELIKRQLRLEMASSYRVWPFCKQHYCDFDIRYSQPYSGDERVPVMKAAFVCPGDDSCQPPPPATGCSPNRY